MKIAVYVDGNGNISRFSTSGSVRLYEKTSDQWVLKSDSPFAIRTEMTLAEIKQAVSALVARLEDCQTFLSGENRGLIYSLLQEEAGFRVWKSQGAPEEQLESLARQDAELAVQRRKQAVEQAIEAQFAGPSGGCGGGGGGRPRRNGDALRTLQGLTESLGEGRYRIDLAAILNRYKNANSMDVLIPIMEGTSFDSLEILCNHVPRWFARKLEELNLTAEFLPLDGPAEGVKALVSPKLAKGLNP